MGCASSRHHPSEEEKSVYAIEQKLKFHKHQATYMDLILRKYSYNFALNSDQFNEVLSYLSVASEKSYPSDKLSEFYGSFKENDAYSLSKLIVLCGLLGKGDPNEKARLFFEAYDVENAKAISRESTEELVDSMIDISAVLLPTLADTSPTGNFYIEKYDGYSKKLAFYRDGAKRQILSSLFAGMSEETNVISLKKFETPFMNSELGKITSSSGMRNYLLSSNKASEEFGEMGGNKTINRST